MTLTESQRRDILARISRLVGDKFYDPTFKGNDWPALVETHREQILKQADRLQFAEAVNEMLRTLKTSGLGLISEQSKITSKNSISATFHQAETEYGQRWVFQDVHAGGPAAQAAIKPGDVLISIGGAEIFAPADKPLFAMGQSHDLVVGQSRRHGQCSANRTGGQTSRQSVRRARHDHCSVPGWRRHCQSPTLSRKAWHRFCRQDQRSI